MNIIKIDSASVIPFAPIMGFDIETSPIGSVQVEKGLIKSPHQSKIVMAQIAVGDNVYILTDNFKSLTSILKNPKITKLAHVAAFEYQYCMHYLGCLGKSFVDTAVIEKLIGCGNSQGSFALASLAKRYLGITLDKRIRQQFIDGQTITDSMIEYGARDAWVLEPLFREQMKKAYPGMQRVLSLESKLLPVVVSMEYAGVKLDKESWMQLFVENETAFEKVKAGLFKFENRKFQRTSMFGKITYSNYNRREIRKQMLSKAGIDLPDFRKSTIEEAARRIKHPLLALLLEYSLLNKATTTYGENFLRHINPVTGRVHQSIQQVEARTGRLAGREPNLMNIPKKSSFRRCFIAEVGKTFVVMDYSQQELRILAEYSGDLELTDAFVAGVDVHLHVARILFKDPEIQYEDPKRTAAKSLNFGLVYGMGAKKLAAALKISMGEAQDLMKIHSKEFHGAFEWSQDILKFVKEHGYIETLLGRRRTIDQISFGFERQARNSPIQGTAADITKIAAVFLFSVLPKEASIVNIVHDEICIECDKAYAKECKNLTERVMINAAGTLVKHVPFAVDGYINERWTNPK